MQAGLAEEGSPGRPGLTDDEAFIPPGLTEGLAAMQAGLTTASPDMVVFNRAPMFLQQT